MFLEVVLRLKHASKPGCLLDREGNSMGFPLCVQRSSSAIHALPSPSPVAAKSLQWGRERKDGAKVRQRMIIPPKTKLQIRALNANANVNGPNSSSSSNQSTYFPQADFYKVEAILRPWRISHVTSGLLKMGIRGVTVSDVKGFGSQGGSLERQAGSEFSEDKFVSKVKMEIVVSKDQVEEVIDAIIDEARTGELGDGKIFVVPVADVIRVRTGERGFKAERMAGGRAELLAGAREDSVKIYFGRTWRCWGEYLHNWLLVVCSGALCSSAEVWRVCRFFLKIVSVVLGVSLVTGRDSSLTSNWTIGVVFFSRSSAVYGRVGGKLISSGRVSGRLLSFVAEAFCEEGGILLLVRMMTIKGGY